MKRKSPTKSTDLIIRSVNLPAEKRALIHLATPSEFIRERPGKGGKTFRYIEGGYVIARLNQIFSPIGWDFSVVNQQIEQTEVIVRGRLEVKDFKTGYSIGKTRTGTKERVAGITLGDTIKAAETDALKKCASHFGIGLDVYWQQLDEDKLTASERKPIAATVESGRGHGEVAQPSKNASMPQTNAQLMKLSLEKIGAEKDATILIQFGDRIKSSRLYNDNQKKVLFSAIEKQLRGNATNISKSKAKGLF